MGLEILVTTSTSSSNLTLPDGREVFEFLGNKDMPYMTLQIREVIEKIFDEIRQTVDFECGVELELSGSLTLIGRAEAKYLILNVGGDAQATTSMTIKLSTMISSADK